MASLPRESYTKGKEDGSQTCSCDCKNLSCRRDLRVVDCAVGAILRVSPSKTLARSEVENAGRHGGGVCEESRHSDEKES